MQFFLDVLQKLANIPSERNPHLCLKNMTRLFAELKLVLKDVLIIHIAGTNGKGSTAYYLYQLLKTKYDSVALYTSPHIHCVTERFLMTSQGTEERISPENFVELYQEISMKTVRLNLRLSYFETLSAIAFLWVFRNNITVSVWEVGLGGRLDATNVLPATHSVITNIALDHQEYLGNDHYAILKEKAGIIKKGQVVYSGIQNPLLRKFLKKIVAKRKAKIVFVPFDHTMNFLEKNKALAKSFFKGVISSDVNEDSIPLKTLDGRMQWMNQNICLDGAHNPHGMQSLVYMLTPLKKKITMILSITKGKSFNEMLDVIVPISSKIWLLERVYDHQMDPVFLKKNFAIRGIKTQIVSLKFLKTIQLKQEELLVCTGSFYALSQLSKVFSCFS